ncbi:uncharacterized protein LOC142976829 [Anticarsia gemmatalis]|uniref:uncharacterized protein LOC142976829 n=1 Tax=Anticarsia gemmatalis TaxID=129554 RepID=UPI003F75BB0E
MGSGSSNVIQNNYNSPGSSVHQTTGYTSHGYNPLLIPGQNPLAGQTTIHQENQNGQSTTKIIVQPLLEYVVQWVPTTVARAIELSEWAVVAGYEHADQTPIWLIRSWYDGHLIPGKLMICHNRALIGLDDREKNVYDIEVCCARKENIVWIPSSDGIVLPNAVYGGHTSEAYGAEKLYVGRARAKNSLTPGKIQPSKRCMYMPFGNRERLYKEYEILCTVPTDKEKK